jgi:hypothetical protein
MIVITTQDRRNKMRKVEGKHVVYTRNDGSGVADAGMAFEEPVPISRINKLRTIWYLLTDKRFYFELEDTVKYAMRHANSYRGDGASDVHAFSVFHSHKMFDKEKGWK